MTSCIYCDTKNIKLTDEHIIPLGLGGDIVLSNSSCLECNKKTSRFENFILRGHWLGIRKKLQTGSRRKNQEPPTLRAKLIRYNGEQIDGRVLSEECNFQLIFDFFRPAVFDPQVLVKDVPCARGAGMILIDVSGPAIFTTNEGKKLRVIPSDQIQYYTHEFTAEHFMRFFAKIAHGFVIKELSEEACSKYFLKEIILGDTKEAMKYIGIASPIVQGARLQKINRFHSLQILEVDNYITVLIQLFNIDSHDPQPIYQVIVGEK